LVDNEALSGEGTWPRELYSNQLFTIRIEVLERILPRIAVYRQIQEIVNASHPWQSVVLFFVSCWQILLQYRIRALPHGCPRVVVARPEVVESRLLVELLSAEEERCPMLVGVLFHPRLPEREVLQVLVELAVQVG